MGKKEELAVIEAEVKACEKCPELCASRTRTVFGHGNYEAKVVLVGEAPGHSEDQVGIPFVGAAGQLLDNILTAMRLDRSKVYVANVVKCRPPGNRVPIEQERENCRHFLSQQLAVLKPSVLVLLGSTASQHILGQPIEACRGQFCDEGGCMILATYHPAAILWEKELAKQREKKLAVWNDLAPLRDWLQKNAA